MSKSVKTTSQSIKRKLYVKDIEKIYYDKQIAVMDEWSRNTPPDKQFEADPALQSKLQDIVKEYWKEKDINKLAAEIAKNPEAYNVETWEDCEDLARMLTFMELN